MSSLTKRIADLQAQLAVLEAEYSEATTRRWEDDDGDGNTLAVRTRKEEKQIEFEMNEDYAVYLSYQSAYEVAQFITDLLTDYVREPEAN